MWKCPCVRVVDAGAFVRCVGRCSGDRSWGALQKPQQNRNGHQKTATWSGRKETRGYNGEAAQPFVLQWFQAIRGDKRNERKIACIELVRMRSPVQIWLAAP